VTANEHAMFRAAVCDGEECVMIPKPPSVTATSTRCSEPPVCDGDEHAMFRAAVRDGDEHAMFRAAVCDGDERAAAVRR